VRDRSSVVYEPFPGFVGWADGFDSTTVDAYANRLDEARAVATPEAMAAAVQVATRYAAVDTGAIEGLYSTNRGFTRTIAEQTPTWQEALRQHGPHVERSINVALNGYEMVLDLATGRRSPSAAVWAMSRSAWKSGSPILVGCPDSPASPPSSRCSSA